MTPIEVAGIPHAIELAFQAADGDESIGIPYVSDPPSGKVLSLSSETHLFGRVAPAGGGSVLGHMYGDVICSNAIPRGYIFAHAATVCWCSVTCTDPNPGSFVGVFKNAVEFAQLRLTSQAVFQTRNVDFDPGDDLTATCFPFGAVGHQFQVICGLRWRKT